MNHQDFVAKVNEIYHDVTAETYAKSHPEIFIDEVNRWRRIAKNHLVTEHPVTILDVGTGSGFVPLTIGPFLKKEDTVICSDISSGMLSMCRKEIAKRQFDCEFRFVRLNGDLTSVIPEPVDFVTLNSVLHHVANIGEFCSQISDALTEDGRLAIVHEPNNLFVDDLLLWNNYKLLQRLENLRAAIFGQLRRKISSTTSKLSSDDDDAQFSKNITDTVNQHLLEEGLVKNSLPRDEMISLVEIHDIYSPSIDGLHKKRGFNLHKLLQRELSDFELLQFETYNHCSKFTTQNWFTRVYANLLQTIFPQKGATFLCVLAKKSNCSST